MRYRASLKTLGRGYYLLIFILFIFVNQGNIAGQKSRFQNFSMPEGLCHPFVYNINQDKNGFLWIGTGEGLCRYDGIEFLAYNQQDSLPSDVVNVSFRDNLGKLWFGFNNGQVWSYDGLTFTFHPFPEDVKTSIIGFTQSDYDGILIATQNKGIFQIDAKGMPVQYTAPFSDKLISAILVSGKVLLVGTQDGLFIQDMNDPSEESFMVDELEYIKIQSIRPAVSENKYWIGTEDEGLFLLDYSHGQMNVSKVGVNFGLQYENIQDIQYDADSNLILCSFNSGLIKLMFDPEKGILKDVHRYDLKALGDTKFIKCAYIDHEKNLWLGTYGDGLLMQASQSFGFYGYERYGLGNSIYSITFSHNYLWMGATKGILRIDKANEKVSVLKNANLPSDQITSLYYMGNTLYAGTGSNGIYRLKDGESVFRLFFRDENSISNSINYITGDGENIYAATKNGIFIINISTGDKLQYSTLNGLPHNDIEHLFLDAENRLLFATRTNGIYEINVRGEVEELFTVGKYELNFNSIAQDRDGNYWVGTYGQGIFLLMPDSIINITARNGLKNDYCYSVQSDDSAYIWVGHRLGLSRIDIRNLGLTVFDSDNGITGDFNQNSVAKKDGMLYFGTTDGLVTYDIKSAYSHRNEPLTNILRVFVSDVEKDFHVPIILPYSLYKLRIDYIGLNYADPEAVRYQYKLEGYDLDWSEITESRTVIYPRIEDGDYTFLLRAIGPDGIMNQAPAQFRIRVKLPVWKTWWFISLSVVIVILLVILIIKVRERKQKQIQEYLERRLDERTREVVEQKEEIEIKNRDITDSINYAQRIQTSILPPIKRLQQYFSGSFIFYQPRDIVSGDFYWFEKIKEDKFVIVCSDSTGHGVPGAFMSMIGTTLIKDVCMRADVNSPSEILRELDVELRNTLNQNVDAEQSNDGMDIIVCELDIRSSYLRYASAMRPMIVYRSGEQMYIKGSRSSVGGQYDKDEKIFKDEGIQLSKGDLIYMFSDGYPDQFGGSVGKKFKMVRLKNLLRDIYQKPMEEQYEYVKSTFNLWKEDFDQVDDVLFMGIKI
jgi:ligand-binding sensor domain-containing protein/serine phosphatase RsbU (regulator of sigma subunit)